MPKRTVVLVAWAFLFLAPFVPAKSKKTPPVDPRLLSAQFVRVVSATGSDINPRTYPEDREAVFAVQNALKKWGRFHVTYEGAAGEPDLIIVVRKGRYGSAVVSPNGPAEPGPVGRMPGQAGPFPVPTGGIRVGTEAGNAPDDMISIYDARLGTDSPPIWRKTMAHGLEDVQGRVPLPLVEELRKDVESAARAQASKP